MSAPDPGPAPAPPPVPMSGSGSGNRPGRRGVSQGGKVAEHPPHLEQEIV
ncbi:hypothetical protein SGM_0473 [Streptomyces griseoaurantiacus M045]|uniref:Uncharacterized protein n=1 Tax=Streptomyces griseoaurantiacus M045 TaxID=996637 RepID=F3NAT9_9ACTN|nr:hypothetical protein SGM_0473 [Streptomyces griseoaurantiacus M045]